MSMWNRTATASPPPWRNCVMKCCERVPEDKQVFLLPCLHAVCSEECLVQFQSACPSTSTASTAKSTVGSLVCKICKTAVPRDYDFSIGKKVIPDQEFLEEIKLVCEQDCPDNDVAVSYCTSCHICLCEDCDKSHSKRTATREHQRQLKPPAAEKQRKLEALGEKSKFCKDKDHCHRGIVATSFCTNCNQRICGECVPLHETEPGHVILNLECEGNALMILFNDLDDKRIQCEEDSEQNKKLKDAYDTAKKILATNFTKIFALVEAQKKEAEKQLKFEFDEKKKILKKWQHYTKIVNTHVDATLRIRDEYDLLHKMGDIGMAKMSTYLSGNLLRIFMMSMDLDAKRVGNWEFYQAKTSENLLKHLRDLFESKRIEIRSTTLAPASDANKETMTDSKIIDECDETNNINNLKTLAVDSLNESSTARDEDDHRQDFVSPAVSAQPVQDYNESISGNSMDTDSEKDAFNVNQRQPLSLAKDLRRGKRKGKPKSDTDFIPTKAARKSAPSSSKREKSDCTRTFRSGYREPPEFIEDEIPEMYRDVEYPLQGQVSLKHDPSELTEEGIHDNDECCSICLDGGDVIECDDCSRVFHPECHIPPLKEVPPGIWKCNYKITKETVEAEIQRKDLPEVQNSQNLPLEPKNNEREYLIACSFLMECYRIKEIPTMRWKFPEGYQKKYKKIPFHLKYIKERLGSGNPEVFSSVEDMLMAFNQMFDQALTYYKREVGPNDPAIFQHAKDCYQGFLKLVQTYYPAYMPLYDGSENLCYRAIDKRV